MRLLRCGFLLRSFSALWWAGLLGSEPHYVTREEMRGQGEHAIDKAFDIPWQSP
jgi:hypothetical protein